MSAQNDKRKTDPERLLVINFEGGGHHHRHVSYLVRFRPHEDPREVRFLLPRGLAEEVTRRLSPDDAVFFNARTEIIEENPTWRKIARFTGRRSLAIWIFIEWLNLRERGRSKLLFLHLETVLYPLAFSPLPRFNVAGLMFRPTFHYMAEGLFVRGQDSWLRFLQKYIVARICACRPGIKQIFLMDPLAARYAATRWHSSKFQFVPDPLGPEPEELRPIGTAAPIRGRALKFILPGALSSRKGIHSAVDAFASATAETRRRAQVFIVGRPDPGYANYVSDNVERLRKSGVEVTTDLRYLGDAEMDSWISACDIVLMPYVDFKGTSGVLIRAAHFGKPVLSTDRGLLGVLVSSHKLGEALDTTDPVTFAGHLDRAVHNGCLQTFVPKEARDFADGADPTVFAAGILRYNRY